jgi:uncharacterized LabA/DUF88 family protein
MAERVVVFIDSQNTYKGAREAFFKPADFHTCGNVDPLRLGALLATRRPAGQPKQERDLQQARVYSGAPTARDPKGYAAHRRRVAAWRSNGIEVVERDLRYPADFPTSKPHEKGIDVSLAIDLVVLAIENAYDVGIVVSSDTDLRPAVDYVRTKGVQAIEICAWAGRNPMAQPNKTLWCHFLSRADYEEVSDYRDYNVAK